MIRFIGLFIFCVLVIGALLTFNIPLHWIGTLPGDISVNFRGVLLLIPFTTAIIFSLFLSIVLFLFAPR